MARTLAAAALLAFPAVAAAEDVPICTDRPTKANAVCTVPATKWQLETNAAGWSRSEAGGTEVTVLTVGSSVVKLGLSDRSDLQIGVAPYVHSESKAGGIKSSASGFGDIIVRYKHRFTTDGAPVQAGAIPFVKLPSADGDLGSGKVEGGLALPIAISTGGPVTVVLADSDGGGHHAAIVNLVNVSGPIAEGLTIAGELWTMTNFDPADTITLASADVAVAHAFSNELQLDLGANFGLNRNTPKLELSAGVSLRF
jgi:hypothetical protein